MTNKEITRYSAPVVQAYRDMEDELLRLIGEQLGKDGRLTDTSKWRIRQLARAGEINREALQIIDSYAGGITREVYDAITEAAESEVGRLDEAMMNLLSEKGELTGDVQGMLNAYERQSRQELNVKNAEIADSYARALTERCNLVNTVMGYSTRSSFIGAVNEVYRETQRQDVISDLNTGAMTVVSGNESLHDAVRKTIHRMAKKGIPGFIDKAGREWSPEAYVKMDLRTTMANTARAAQDARCDEMGIFLIEVSSHMGARPKCAPYQGRIFSRNGTRGTTTDLDGGVIEYIPLSETSYGEPDGLFGINCGHQQYPFIPGLSVQRYYPYPEEQNAQRYKEMQTQRAMERDIRADKRECMMLQAAGDKDGLKEAAKQLSLDRDKYRDYSKAHGLGVHNENTQVYGYDRSKSMKTVWAERTKGSGNSGSAADNLLTSGSDGGKINYARKILDEDHELYPGLVNAEQLTNELQKTEIGRHALDYINKSNVVVKLQYERPYHYNRGQQYKDEITLFMTNIDNPLVAAQTVAHEVCHHEYKIGQCQWAEAVCFCHEKMLKENRTWLTFGEKRKMVELAKKAYPELNWKKGGIINGKAI